MSSTLVLARKYRPRTFDELVGQPHVVQALSNALRLQRLHHAYLFTGTRGIGKTTVSRILAKSLNCVGPDGQGGITATPCGRCDPCRDIDAGRFIDYVELDAASNRGVDEISSLLEQAVYKPVEGRFKVFMIDEVHMLSTTAFNAMLKTLEEPPDYLKFILATTDPQKIPVTVLSRCLQFNLRPVNAMDVQSHLDHILRQEGIAADPGAVRLLARFARGSMRDGLSLTDQAIAYGAGRIAEDVVRQMLGAVHADHVVGLLGALVDQDGARLLSAIDALRTQGVSAVAVLEEMAQTLHHMAVAQQVPGALDALEVEVKDILRLAQALPADEIQLFYSMVLQSRGELAHAPDEYSGLAMAMLRMLAFRQRHPDPAPERAGGTGRPAQDEAALPPAPLERAEAEPPRPRATATPAAHSPAMPAADGRTVAQPAQAREPLPPLREADTHAPGGEAQHTWTQWLRPLLDSGAITALVRELAVQSQCVGITHGAEPGDATPARVALRVERETLASEANRLKLETALSDTRGQSVRLEIQIGAVNDSIAIRETIRKQEKQTAAESLIHNDDQVKALLQQFKSARIVPGSIKPAA
jgi:DNA polymerase-3 subunit gamma/tau